MKVCISRLGTAVVGNSRLRKCAWDAPRAGSLGGVPRALFSLLLFVSLPCAGAAERFPFVIPGDDASPSITDLSPLSPKPAGADGFVRVAEGHFATAAGRLRIWGMNTCFGSNFPTHDDAQKVAAHLAKLGVNGLRMHHHDTLSAPGGIWGPVVNGHRTLDAEQLDRQDYFLDQLHRHGIYANLNLHVGREFGEREGFATKDLPRTVRYGKYLLYFEPRMRELLKQFCREYLGHYNPYRKLKRSDDPGIGMIEITNENSFSKLGPGIAAGLPEPYRGEFKRQWNVWLAQRYESTAALRRAWGDESLQAGNVDIPDKGARPAALSDAGQFMVDTETGFIRDLMEFLKKDLGVRVPVTASQITYHSPAIVAETCDYTDIHAYWQHPRFPHKPWDRVDWNIANTPMEMVPGSDALLGRTPWRLFGRPCTISEWNIPDPHDYAASAVPFAAMVAALQDWDGVFFFQYESGGDWYTDKMKGFFSFNGQPVKLALFTACANLYRRGDLAPLEQTAAGTLDELLPATLALSRRLGIDPKAKSPGGTDGSASGVSKAQEVVRQPLAARAAEIGKPSGPPKPSAKRLASADGRAVWDATDRQRAYVSVNSPATRAVWGLVGGRSFELGHLRLRVGEVEHNYAAVVVTSMDGQPLERSKRLLLVAVGSAENRGMVWNAARTSVGDKWGSGPTQVNGITADLELPLRVRRIQALDGRGEPMGEVSATRTGGATRFSISPAHHTLWYALEAE